MMPPISAAIKLITAKIIKNAGANAIIPNPVFAISGERITKTQTPKLIGKLKTSGKNNHKIFLNFQPIAKAIRKTNAAADQVNKFIAIPLFCRQNALRLFPRQLLFYGLLRHDDSAENIKYIVLNLYPKIH